MKRKKHLCLFLSLLTVLSLVYAAPACAEEETSANTIPTNQTTPDTSALAGELYSDYALVEDTSTGQILLDKNSTDRIYPASMTKIMTVILGIENLTDLNDRKMITSEMLEGLAEADASVMGLQVGDLPTAEDLFYGAALPSGADACNAIAYRVAGGMSAFVDMMNKKAAELGMTDTHFVNPTGLHDDDHYTTCADMAKLLSYCIQNETFCTVFSASSYTTTSLSSSPDGIWVESTSKSVIEDNGLDLPGFIGAKTGYTPQAGHCMSSWAELNNMNLVIVTAHADTDYYSPDHIIDAQTILQYFSGWERKQMITSGQTASTITVHSYKEDSTIEISTYEDLALDVPSDTSLTLDTTFPAEADAELDAYTITGYIRLYSPEQIFYCAETAVKIHKEKSFLGRILLYLKAIQQ